MISWIEKLYNKLKNYRYEESVTYESIEAGIIERSGYACGTISSNTFAPGIWAGVQDHPVIVQSGDKKFFLNVTYCNLDKRTIYHKVNENGPYLKKGDKLIIPRITIVDGI